MKSASALVLLALALDLAAGQSLAQGYPEKGRTVRIISPFAPGASTDVLARAYAERLQQRLSIPVIVENKPGAGSMVGIRFVKSQPADGYSFVIASSSIATLPSLYRNADYDPVRDFDAVAGAARSVQILVLHKDVPVNTLAGLVAYSKANPGALSDATAGTGTLDHLFMELFMMRTGAKITVVPYKGAAALLPDLVSGRVHMTVTSPPTALQHLRSGVLKPIGVGGDSRHPMVPNVPTFKELGFSFRDAVWWMFFGPAGIPKPIVERLNTEMNTIQQEPEFRKRMDDIGYQTFTRTPAELQEIVAAEYPEWTQVIKSSGIRLD